MEKDIHGEEDFPIHKASWPTLLRREEKGEYLPAQDEGLKCCDGDDTIAFQWTDQFSLQFPIDYHLQLTYLSKT